MKFSNLWAASAVILTTLGGAVTAQAMQDRPRYDSRYDYRDYRGDYRHYRSDRDRRYGHRYDRRDRHHDRRNYDRDRYYRDRSYDETARRNYEHERDLQTCYRDGRRICP